MSPTARVGEAGAAANGFVVAACGLAMEARIAAGRNVRSVAGGVDARRLADALAHEVAHGARAVVSFGIAGALAPDIAAGACVVARGVAIAGTYHPCDNAWTALLRERLPDARFGAITARDQVLASAAAKRALHVETSALSVDTESHVAAGIAAANGLPFVAVRVIADAADRDLPVAAIVALKRDGRVDVAAVLRSLAASPSQLPLLVRAALDAQAAFASLRRVRDRLGEDLGFRERR